MGKKKTQKKKAGANMGPNYLTVKGAAGVDLLNELVARSNWNETECAEELPNIKAALTKARKTKRALMSLMALMADVDDLEVVIKFDDLDV